MDILFKGCVEYVYKQAKINCFCITQSNLTTMLVLEGNITDLTLTKYFLQVIKLFCLYK